MPTQEEITKLQEQAQELVNNLDELYKQVGSYRSAKDELQKASSELLGLVESTRRLCDESHEIIKAVNQIGSARILERLDEVVELAGSAKHSLEEGFQTIKTVNQDGKAEILEWLDGLDRSLRQASRRQTIILACGFGLVITLQIVLFILARS